MILLKMVLLPELVHAFFVGYHLNMKYLIVSDVHSSPDAVKKIIKIKYQLSCDAVINCGDLCPVTEDDIALSSSFLSVSGNCDRYYSLPFDLPLKRQFLFSGRTVTVTHGDRYVYSDFDLKSGDIFISGHTHIPLLEKTGSGIILINPGSAARPRSKEGKTVAVLSEAEAEIISFTSLATLKKIAL